MDQITLGGVQVNPFSLEKNFLVQYQDENGQIQQTIIRYEDLSPADQQTVDTFLQFAQSKMP